MFTIITEEKQRDFERIYHGTDTADNVPMICGTCGRACRQMNDPKGACKAACTHCPLAEHAEQLDNQLSEAPAEPEAPEHRTASASYEIRENRDYGSREVYFTGKPAAETREALKALKMRWNPKKGCWYGFATEYALIAAIQGAETEADGGAVVSTEGYMGGGAVYGSKSNLHLYGADLAAAIRADLKAAGIKGVTVRCKTYTGGQSLTLTATVERQDIRADYALTAYDVSNEMSRCFGCMYDGEQNIYINEFCDMSREEQNAAAERISAYEREKYAKSQQINHYYLDKYTEFSAAFSEKMQKVLEIVRAYRYDASNSMVDYFDTNFYYDLNTKPGKSWAA